MKDFFNKNSTRKGGKKFEGGKKFVGGKKFGGGGGSWNRDDDRGERPSMHKATCGKCSAPCEVPFKPNGKKPIYCNACFRKEDGGTSSPRYGAKKFDRSSSFEKPAFRSAPRADNDEVVKQLKALNVKMDQLLKALTGTEEEVVAEGFSLPEVDEEVEEDEDEDEEDDE